MISLLRSLIGRTPKSAVQLVAKWPKLKLQSTANLISTERMDTTEDQLPARGDFIRRTLLLGILVNLVSLLAGIGLVFYREYGLSLRQIPKPIVYRLLIDATLAPLFMGFYFLFPVTIPVLSVLVVLIVVGVRRRRIWLAALAFVLQSLYWLWLVKSITEGAFD
jgi:hypothetical protein